jgi:transcriptional regulator with XRE-family HTH domain
MSAKLHNRVRAYRKRSGLSQEQLSRLLGASDAKNLSLIERFARIPNLHTALALQASLGVPVHELFPSLNYEVETLTAHRAGELARDVAAASPTKKREFRLRSLNSIQLRKQAPGSVNNLLPA